MATNRFLPDDDIELSDEQITNLAEARRYLPKLKQHLTRAKQAGIDVTEQEANLKELEQQLTKLHNAYGRKPVTSQ